MTTEEREGPQTQLQELVDMGATRQALLELGGLWDGLSPKDHVGRPASKLRMCVGFQSGQVAHAHTPLTP